MKKIVFLVIVSLLVIGLVLPGCGGGGGGAYVPYRALKTAGTLKIGVCGAMGFDQGLHAKWGAELAATTIGSFSVGNQSVSVTIVPVETDEILNPGGAGGTSAVVAAIANVDFMIGGFRTEGLLVYREPIMSANMTFIDCGAATEALCHSVITNYNRYQWFFKGTPMNDQLVAWFQGKIFTMVLYAASTTLASYNKTYIPQVAIIAEDAEWSRYGRESALAKFQAAGISVGQGLWLVPTTAADITSTLNSVNASSPNIIYTIMSGPVGMTYAKQVGGVMPYVQSVGTNVEAQRPAFATEATYANGMIFTDYIAPGLNMTSQTLAFLAAWAGAHGGWPIYTGGTYDAVYTLKEALQSEGYVVGSEVRYYPEDIVGYIETATREGAAAKKTGVYPLWDGVTTGTYYEYVGKTTPGLPAMNESQVLALYPWLTGAGFSNGTVVTNWTYNSDDWTMAPHTSHDLVFGTEWTNGIGSQWQWNGTGVSKVCIWPKKLQPALPSDIPTFKYYISIGAINASTLYGLQSLGLWDKYGLYNYEYPGTGSVNLTNWIGWLLTIF